MGLQVELNTHILYRNLKNDDMHIVTILFKNEMQSSVFKLACRQKVFFVEINFVLSQSCFFLRLYIVGEYSSRMLPGDLLLSRSTIQS